MLKMINLIKIMKLSFQPIFERKNWLKFNFFYDLTDNVRRYIIYYVIGCSLLILQLHQKLRLCSKLTFFVYFSLNPKHQ